MTQVAHFDIYPSSNSNSYNGAWSSYPYLPSGNIIVSGIEQGLFVLQSPNNFGAGGGVRKRTLMNDNTLNLSYKGAIILCLFSGTGISLDSVIQETMLLGITFILRSQSVVEHGHL